MKKIGTQQTSTTCFINQSTVIVIRLSYKSYRPIYKKGIVKTYIDDILYQSIYPDCNMGFVQKHIRESMEN